jgi:heme-degrading monooxygenase HmoA
MGSFMPTVFARLPVKNFDTWHAEFERMHPFRADLGERSHQAYRDVDAPHIIVAVFQWDTLANARSYFNSAELRASVHRGTGQAAPEVHYLEGPITA